MEDQSKLEKNKHYIYLVVGILVFICTFICCIYSIVFAIAYKERPGETDRVLFETDLIE